MALAAAWTLRLVVQTEARWFTLQGCAIMLLAGIAMQIKYVAMFEGMFFGLTLLWLGLGRGWSLAVLAGYAVVWIICALLPTAAALGGYAAMGHGTEFVQANFLSIFSDTNLLLEGMWRLAALTFGLSPLLLCFGIVWRGRAEIGLAVPRAVAWMLGWAIASYAGFLIYGIWYDHYVLPVLMPLSVMAALAFGSVASWRRLAGLVVGLGLVGGTARAVVDVQLNGNARQLAHMSALVGSRLGKGCLYVNEELSALYMTTRSCLPTRYVFPQHLALEAFQHALGIDQLGELRRVLVSRPAVIVVSLTPDEYTLPETRGLLEASVKRDYRLAGTGNVGATRYAVYALASVRSEVPLPK
jgi:hypothetical protein